MENFRLYSSFPDVVRWVNVTFGKKSFRGACQKFLLRVQRNLLEKITLWKLSYRWLNLEFERKPCGTIFNLFLRVQWNSVKSCTLWEKSKTLSFPHNMWNFIATSNDIGWIVKLAIIISSGRLWGQSSFEWKRFQVFTKFGLWARNTGQSCHICFLGVEGNNLEENWILKWSLFFSIRLNDFW